MFQKRIEMQGIHQVTQNNIWKLYDCISTGHTQAHNSNRKTMPSQWIPFIKHIPHASETYRKSIIHLKTIQGSIWFLADEEQAVAGKHVLHTDRYAHMTICTMDTFIKHLSHVSETCRKARGPPYYTKQHMKPIGLPFQLDIHKNTQSQPKDNAFTMDTFYTALITCFRNS